MSGQNSSRKISLLEDFSGRLDVGCALGAPETAMYLYDVEPGDAFPYHYEYVPEWLLVVEGALVVRIPGGELDVERGELVRFPPGPEGAHQILNRGHATARALLFSSSAAPAVSVYPDADVIGVFPDDDTELYFKRDTAVPRDAVG